MMFMHHGIHHSELGLCVIISNMFAIFKNRSIQVTPGVFKKDTSDSIVMVANLMAHLAPSGGGLPCTLAAKNLREKMTMYTIGNGERCNSVTTHAIFLYYIMTSNIECDVLHGSKPEDCMPPWVAQVLSLVVWGSQNSWFGLSCPAHCNSSLLLHLVVFLSGLSCGALIALIALWSFGLLPLGFRGSNLPARRPPSLRLLSSLTCMSGQLAEAVRTVIATLRSLANTLESALARAEVTNSVPPVLDLESAHSWEFPASAAPEPAAVQFSTPRNGSAPALTASSPARTSYSTNSYHEVADSLPGLPGYCLDWCIRLGGTKEEITARASRAWFAGCWARAAADGRVPKPRPTPQLSLRATVYVILRAPGLDRPVRVGTAAEYFRLLPSFKNGSNDSNSISHSFPSLAEAKVYCAAFGIDLPEQQWRP